MLFFIIAAEGLLFALLLLFGADLLFVALFLVDRLAVLRLFFAFLAFLAFFLFFAIFNPPGCVV